jgi:hypothetical protein
MAMRTLGPPPATVVDPQLRRPHVGSFAGPLPPVDLGPLAGAMTRLLRRKRWIYAAVATDAAFVGLAIVDLGYASNCFAFTWLAGQEGLAVDRSHVGPPGAARVGDRAGEGCLATFTLPRARARIERGADSRYAVSYRGPGFELDVRLDSAGAPPPIAAIADLGDGRVNTTEKRALLVGEGHVQIGGRRVGLDGALGGLDYTHGLLRRRTAWRWAFALGRARSGERVAFNLVEGFVGEPECALWIDDRLYPLAEGRFGYDLAAPLRPWTVRTADGAVDLHFEPGGMHAERKRLGLVASTFLQPVGRYRGTIAVPGRASLELDGAPGVAEHQDVLW